MDDYRSPYTSRTHKIAKIRVVGVGQSRHPYKTTHSLSYVGCIAVNVELSVSANESLGRPYLRVLARASWRQVDIVHILLPERVHVCHHSLRVVAVFFCHSTARQEKLW